MKLKSMNLISKKSGAYSKIAGYSLIEVLVAMVITSIGLMGVAFLITLGIQKTQGSEQMGVATDLAQQAIDMMKANRLEAYRMVGVNADRATSCAVADALENTPVDRRRIWDCRMHRMLPNSAATWELNNGVITVNIVWDRSRGEQDENVTSQIALESRLE